MRFLLLLTLLAAGPLSVFGAMLKNAKVAKALTAASKPPRKGAYYFKNVKTGQMIAYKRESHQSMVLAKKGSLMTTTPYGKYMKVTPSASNNKCWSAQWHFGRGEDWANVLYKCTKTNKHTVLKRDQRYTEEEHLLEKRKKKKNKMGPVRSDKQLWIVKPAKVKHAYFLITTDHITDQATKAIGHCVISQVQNRKSKGLCLEKWSQSDRSQMWTMHNRQGKLLKRDFVAEAAEESLAKRDLFDNLPEYEDGEDLDTSEMESYDEI